MATCETNGHLWNSQRKCIMCKCDRPEEPDTYLQEGHPGDVAARTRVARHGALSVRGVRLRELPHG